MTTLPPQTGLQASAAPCKLHNLQARLHRSRKRVREHLPWASLLPCRHSRQPCKSAPERLNPLHPLLCRRASLKPTLMGKVSEARLAAGQLTCSSMSGTSTAQLGLGPALLALPTAWLLHPCMPLQSPFCSFERFQSCMPTNHAKPTPCCSASASAASAASSPAASNLGVLQPLAAPDPQQAALFLQQQQAVAAEFSGGGVINVDGPAIAASLLVLLMLLALSFNRILGLERLLG